MPNCKMKKGLASCEAIDLYPGNGLHKELRNDRPIDLHYVGPSC
jgi:hypothetical protein